MIGLEKVVEIVVFQKSRMKARGSTGRHTYIPIESDFIVLSTQKWPQYMHGTAYTPKAW